jgi:hypothetical protein
MNSAFRHQVLSLRECNVTAAHNASSSSNTASSNVLARDVRPVSLKIVSVGKGNSEGAMLMAEEWAEKVRTGT